MQMSQYTPKESEVALFDIEVEETRIESLEVYLGPAVARRKEKGQVNPVVRCNLEGPTWHGWWM